MYSAQCTMYNVHCTVYKVQVTRYKVQCTMYNVQCTMYNIQGTRYKVQGTLYIVQCTILQFDFDSDSISIPIRSGNSDSDAFDSDVGPHSYRSILISMRRFRFLIFRFDWVLHWCRWFSDSWIHYWHLWCRAAQSTCLLCCNKALPSLLTPIKHAPLSADIFDSACS